MPVLIVVPRFNSKLGPFWWKIIEKSSKIMFFRKSCVFLRKKSPRQGCTKPKTELGMHQNPHFHQNSLKINKNPPSTITKSYKGGSHASGFWQTLLVAQAVDNSEGSDGNGGGGGGGCGKYAIGHCCRVECFFDVMWSSLDHWWQSLHQKHSCSCVHSKNKGFPQCDGGCDEGAGRSNANISGWVFLRSASNSLCRSITFSNAFLPSSVLAASTESETTDRSHAVYSS